ncbi:MAG TPA: FtsX-like permease family protein, partial [Gemmatimonadaceae bacterium]|nr:FtsX-like permease family protein [Gemmatimonadaceae bacterium]
RGVHVVSMQLWTYYQTGQHREAFVRLAAERLRAIPGVESAGVTSALPLDHPIGLELVRVEIEGEPTTPGEEPLTIRTSAITPGLLDALGIPVREGRAFTTADRAGTTPVALVNETFARRHFPHESAIGKRVSLGFQSQPIAREIVGIVGDVRHDGLHVPAAPGIYVPHSQAPTGAVHFVVRAPSVVNIDRQVRALFAELNGAMPLTQTIPMDALVRRSLAQRRFQLGLLVCFSVTALLLAAIGIYGVMSRATSERTHEIGVRMAMGARAGDVRWMVLRSGGVLAVAGVTLGLGAAVLLTRTMTGMLFGVGPLDPLTYAAAAAVLVVVALLATLVPAWRASTVAPVDALRNE